MTYNTGRDINGMVGKLCILVDGSLFVSYMHCYSYASYHLLSKLLKSTANVIAISNYEVTPSIFKCLICHAWNLIWSDYARLFDLL